MPNELSRGYEKDGLNSDNQTPCNGGGYADGHSDGWEGGHTAGYSVGYAAGLEAGREEVSEDEEVETKPPF